MSEFDPSNYRGADKSLARPGRKQSRKHVRKYRDADKSLAQPGKKQVRKHVRKYRDADKSLARPGRKQARKHVRDARDFNNIEKRAAFKLFFLQGKEPKEIHVILTETLACFLLGRAQDLSAPLYEKKANLEV